MSNPYPPPPKRLVRSTRSRVIGGVCGGVAEYLNMDANLVRILTVLISLFTGVPVILYVIALFVMPEDSAPSAPPPVAGASSYGAGSTGPESAYAPYPPPRPDEAVWGAEGPPWEQRQPQPEPVAPSQPEAPVAPAPDQSRPAEDRPPTTT